MSKEKSTFEHLYAINVTDKTSTKVGMTYLPWASAWAIIKKEYPEAEYIFYENVDHETGMVCPYFTDGKNGTCWVKVGTKLHKEGICYDMVLYVMDYKNNSIPADKITSRDWNTSLMRCLVKSLAMHGLGLYIYEKDDSPPPTEKPKPTPAKKKLKPLKVGDKNWSSLVKYVEVNKKMGLEKLIQSIGRDYQITQTVKTEIAKIIK
jgi:hypothetical protein